ncbi:hypothetical protein OSCI_1090010 [Kamptonema sp. PCC 6506]|uniref:hypothetical protein n=1 Tax=Kamptonema formosum TaxID=331992 RepID=UPI0001DAD731|nr:hypothetical protein [Kamptonema formosum]CBN54780.1 hypothetical protein OSCI_1090010 [Kamptonema sp. PCC 6506]
MPKIFTFYLLRCRSTSLNWGKAEGGDGKDKREEGDRVAKFSPSSPSSSSSPSSLILTS